MTKKRRSFPRWPIAIALLVAIFVSPLIVVIPRLSTYTAGHYSQDYYKSLESAFNSSQYRKKDNPGIIPDETVFSYAAGAYLRGLDPILVNSEHTPLGKYFLAASIFVFRNDRTIILLFAMLSGLSIWLVAKEVLKDGTWGLIPVLLVSVDTLFRNQLVTVPLLDIIQLPFIYFALAAFLYEKEKGNFFWTAVSIGCVMATKSIVPGLLLVAAMGIFLLLGKQMKLLLRLAAWMLLAACVFTLTYVRTFMSGYTFWDFLKFQKWIFLYQKSKLIYPFSSLRLLLFNQWQSWWGDFSILRADDWSYLWPVSTIASFVMAVWLLIKKRWQQVNIGPVVLVTLWVVIYQAFLSIGVVSSRFFIPVLPAQYMLLVIAVLWVIRKMRLFKYAAFASVFFGILLILPGTAYAEYVLPYPSYMPGNKLYQVSRILDRVKQPFYFGNIGSYKYRLMLTDKYLVEAKTLFEYKQYLLAADALGRSDEQFRGVPAHLTRATQEGKDTMLLRAQFQEACDAHVRVLTKLVSSVPKTFTWQPEKVEKTELPIGEMLRDAIKLRKTCGNL